MTRQLVRGGNKYADEIGLSRAVRVGNAIVVGGTAPIGLDGKTIGLGDVSAQTRRCIKIIQKALFELGADLSDVVRTRTMLKNIDDWKKVAEVRKEFFQESKPTDTVVEVSRFVNPEWLIEIEMDAILDK